MMGMTSCLSYGWLPNYSNGICKEPTTEECLDQQNENCFKDSYCVIEL